jgi:hypothetical protein
LGPAGDGGNWLVWPVSADRVAMAKELRGTRYLTVENEPTSRFIVNELPYLDFDETLTWYREIEPALNDKGRALMNCNDRYYLLTMTCKRRTLGTHGCSSAAARWSQTPTATSICGRAITTRVDRHLCRIIQEILVDPEITIAIMSGTNKVAQPFLIQIRTSSSTTRI